MSSMNNRDAILADLVLNSDDEIIKRTSLSTHYISLDHAREWVLAAKKDGWDAGVEAVVQHVSTCIRPSEE